jgi:hypothetical protein
MRELRVVMRYAVGDGDGKKIFLSRNFAPVILDHSL